MFKSRQQFRVLHATDEGGATGAPEKPEAEGGKDGEPEPEPEPTAQDDGRTVNRYKHEREVGRLNAEIDGLKAELEKARGREGDAANVKEELDALKAELADERLSAKLAAAGCIDPKAAKARLEEFDGDVAKLAEACPYLFEQAAEKNVGSTGGQPAPGGASKTIEDRIESVFKKR